jgi:hypothetical protein
MIVRSNRSVQDFSERKLWQGKASLAANAGASKVFAVSVPTNSKAVIRGIVRASAGVIAAPIPVTVANGTETFTAGAAHGYTTVVPCFVTGTVLPAGTVAGTIYYAWGSSTTAFQLYDTMANALVHNGSTGLIAVTTDGTAVNIVPTSVDSVHQVFAAVSNRNGNAVLLGSPVIDSLEVVSGWDCTVTADNTDKNLQLNFTPDTALVTKVEWLVEIYKFALSAA